VINPDGVRAMKKIIIALVLLLPISPSVAGWDKGRSAYGKGDYATALCECKASTEQRHTPASKPDSHPLIRLMWPIVLDACG